MVFCTDIAFSPKSTKTLFFSGLVTTELPDASVYLQHEELSKHINKVLL